MARNTHTLGQSLNPNTLVPTKTIDADGITTYDFPGDTWKDKQLVLSLITPPVSTETLYKIARIAIATSTAQGGKPKNPTGQAVARDPEEAIDRPTVLDARVTVWMYLEDNVADDLARLAAFEVADKMIDEMFWHREERHKFVKYRPNKREWWQDFDAYYRVHCLTEAEAAGPKA